MTARQWFLQSHAFKIVDSANWLEASDYQIAMAKARHLYLEAGRDDLASWCDRQIKASEGRPVE